MDNAGQVACQYWAAEVTDLWIYLPGLFEALDKRSILFMLISWISSFELFYENDNVDDIGGGRAARTQTVFRAQSHGSKIHVPSVQLTPDETDV